MKVLAKLIGRVNVFNPPPQFSYVTLKNIDNGEVIDSNAVSEKLVSYGITQKDDEFQILIYEDEDGKQMGNITKLEPKPFSAEQIEEIKKVQDIEPSGGDFAI